MSNLFVNLTFEPTIPTDADNNLTVPSKSEAEVDNWGFGEFQ